MTLAPYVRIVARGKGRARAMTMAESREAMTLILNGDAAPEAVGALLMVMRLRGETAEEIAGFTAALRAHVIGTLPSADLDWPSYAAGRSEALSPAAFDLLALRDTFGLRSCFNTVLRMWNPSNAPVTVQGVFHPSYRSLQAQAADLLGQKQLSIIKGGGGEFERHPSKEVTVFGLRDGLHIQQAVDPIVDETRRLHEAGAPIDLRALWRGSTHDPFSVATITGSAALALWTLKAAPTIRAAENMAHDLWANRHQHESLSA